MKLKKKASIENKIPDDSNKKKVKKKLDVTTPKKTMQNKKVDPLSTKKPKVGTKSSKNKPKKKI